MLTGVNVPREGGAEAGPTPLASLLLPGAVALAVLAATTAGGWLMLWRDARPNDIVRRTRLDSLGLPLGGAAVSAWTAVPSAPPSEASSSTTIAPQEPSLLEAVGVPPGVRPLSEAADCGLRPKDRARRMVYPGL